MFLLRAGCWFALVGLIFTSTARAQMRGHASTATYSWGGHAVAPQGLGFNNTQNLGFSNLGRAGFSVGQHGNRPGHRAGYYSPGYYNGLYGGGFYGGGLYGGGFYGGPAFYATPGLYGNAFDYESPYPPDLVQPGGPEGPPPAVQWIPPPRADAAEITVRVPADAEVWIEGVKMKQQGPVRKFTSPQLAIGMSYVYDIKAAWTENGKPVSDTQHVSIRAGDRLSVTFVTR